MSWQKSLFSKIVDTPDITIVLSEMTSVLFWLPESELSGLQMLLDFLLQVSDLYCGKDEGISREGNRSSTVV